MGNRTQHPRQIPCFITHTNEQTHDVIRNNLDRSPMYAGVIEGIGPRYCPSIEDKVMRFADKTAIKSLSNQKVWTTTELYPNGISTSCRLMCKFKSFVNERFENAQIVRPGYAIEYDFFDPRDLKQTYETKFIKVCSLLVKSTVQLVMKKPLHKGLMAGLNASLFSQGKEAGAHVAIKPTWACWSMIYRPWAQKPYRMFTSRAEYRLLLREDNADLRLTEKARELGLVSDARWARFNQKIDNMEKERQRLKETWMNPNSKALMQLNALLKTPMSREASGESARRPEMDYDAACSLPEFGPALEDEAAEQVEIQVKYEGYISVKKTRSKNLCVTKTPNCRADLGLQSKLKVCRTRWSQAQCS